MLEVFEIYQPPQADRNKIAGKMLGHVLIVFAALAVVMVKLFLCIGADSARNRDAVRKVTSPETEQWALIVLLVFVAAVIYLSVAGFLLSRKVRRQFTAWVYNEEKLYVVTARVPSAGRYSSPRRVSSVFQIQERALEILHDPRMLVSLIEGTVSEPLFHVTPVTEVRRIRQREQEVIVYFDRYREKISKKNNKFRSTDDAFASIRSRVKAVLYDMRTGLLFLQKDLPICEKCGIVVRGHLKSPFYRTIGSRCQGSR